MGRMLNPGVSGLPRNQGIGSESQPLRPVTASPGNPFAVLPVPEAVQSGFQRLAFRASLAMLFVRLAGLPELLASLLHVDTYLLYIVGPPAILGAFVTGGVARTFKHRAAWAWLGFLTCMMLSVPTSVWLGGSVKGFR